MEETQGDTAPLTEPQAEPQQPTESPTVDQTPTEVAPQPAAEPTESADERMIPFSRHKQILENARKETGRESSPPTPDYSDLGLDPAASKILSTVAQREMEGKLTAVQTDLVKNIREQVESDLQFRAEVDSLTKEFDGKDGLPKFDLKAVQDHGIKTGIYNLRAAYENMTNQKWKELERQRIANELAKNPPASSEMPGRSTGAVPTEPEQPKLRSGDRKGLTNYLRQVRESLQGE